MRGTESGRERGQNTPNTLVLSLSPLPCFLATKGRESKGRQSEAKEDRMGIFETRARAEREREERVDKRRRDGEEN